MGRSTSAAVLAVLCGVQLMGNISLAETRYERWQEARPFTQTAWYTSVNADAAGNPPPAVSLPPAWPLPDMELYQRAGLNLVTDVTGFRGKHPQTPGEGYAAIAQAQAAGVPYFITLHGEAPLQKFERFVGYLADDPRWSGLAGVYLADEPQPAKDEGQHWKNLTDRAALIRQRWPHLITLVGNATNFENGLHPYARWIHDRLIQDIQPDVSIHQFYPFNWSPDGRANFQWYPIMDYYSEFAKKTGTGFWSYPLTGCKRMPMSESAHRLEKFGALAYGVQGFMDFGYDLYHYDEPIFKPPSVNHIQYVNIVKQSDGTLKEAPTEYFPMHARINREVANLTRSLIRLRHVRTYHVDAVPTYQHFGHLSENGALQNPHRQREQPVPAPDEYYDWFEWSVHRFNEKDDLRSGKLREVRGAVRGVRDLDTDELRPDHRTLVNSLMVGFFTDTGGEEYFMVVNKEAMTETERPVGEPPVEGRLPGENWAADDPRAVQQVTLVFDPGVKAIQRLSRLTGEVENIELIDHEFTFELPGGTGDLFKYKTGDKFAGIE